MNLWTTFFSKSQIRPISALLYVPSSPKIQLKNSSLSCSINLIDMISVALN